MKLLRSVFLFLALLLAGAAVADASFTKILTLNHIGSPSENDGFHPEAFVLEQTINDNTHYSIGILENSEERLGLIIGYSRIFYQTGRLDLTGNFYLSSNYKRLPVVVPVPTLGVRYHLTPRTDLLVEAVPFHDEGEPYLIFMTGINFDL